MHVQFVKGAVAIGGSSDKIARIHIYALLEEATATENHDTETCNVRKVAHCLGRSHTLVGNFDAHLYEGLSFRRIFEVTVSPVEVGQLLNTARQGCHKECEEYVYQRLFHKYKVIYRATSPQVNVCKFAIFSLPQYHSSYTQRTYLLPLVSPG